MVNKVILVGRLGRDPEVRYMTNGEAVANFSVATSETWKDRNGQKQERTEWHNLVMYSKLAEVAGKYLKKGGQVYIEGRIRSRKYTGKDGIERTAYEIQADNMTMLGSKSDSSSATNAPSDTTPHPSQRAQRNDYAAAKQGSGVAPVVNDLDDDIPF